MLSHASSMVAPAESLTMDSTLAPPTVSCKDDTSPVVAMKTVQAASHLQIARVVLSIARQ